MIFIREDIPVNFLSAQSKPIKGLYIELTFRKENWLLRFSFNNKNNIMNHLNALRRNLDLYFTQY